jgi:iron complex transport system ATP-binding protein
MPELALVDAGFKYGNNIVLRRVNLAAVRGEFCGIIGPNGSGKTTLLKGMAGLIRPYEGAVTLNGKHIGAFNHDYIARNIALVPQNAVLPELFTARDIVLMGRTPHLGRLRYESASDIGIACRAMEITQTLPLAGKHINELSGGERQRIIIARMIAQEAGILLLDEPTANLDINYQAEILSFLRQLCQEKDLSIFAALHDLNLASQYCDRLIVLNEKHIWKQGKPADIIDAPTIKEVFGVNIHVFQHPLNGRPAALVTSQDQDSCKENKV